MCGLEGECVGLRGSAVKEGFGIEGNWKLKGKNRGLRHSNRHKERNRLREHR